MSRRHLVSKYAVWADLDSSTPSPSVSTVVESVDTVKYTLKVDSTVAGELFVDFSDDKDGLEDWKPLDFSTQLIINGASDTDYTVVVRSHACKKMRLRFVNNVGTGVINAWYSSSSVGA